MSTSEAPSEALQTRLNILESTYSEIKLGTLSSHDAKLEIVMLIGEEPTCPNAIDAPFLFLLRTLLGISPYPFPPAFNYWQSVYLQQLRRKLLNPATVATVD